MSREQELPKKSLCATRTRVTEEVIQTSRNVLQASTTNNQEDLEDVSTTRSTRLLRFKEALTSSWHKDVSTCVGNLHELWSSWYLSKIGQRYPDLPVSTCVRVILLPHTINPYTSFAGTERVCMSLKRNWSVPQQNRFQFPPSSPLVMTRTSWPNRLKVSTLRISCI